MKRPAKLRVQEQLSGAAGRAYWVSLAWAERSDQH